MSFAAAAATTIGARLELAASFCWRALTAPFAIERALAISDVFDDAATIRQRAPSYVLAIRAALAVIDGRSHTAAVALSALTDQLAAPAATTIFGATGNATVSFAGTEATMAAHLALVARHQTGRDPLAIAARMPHQPMTSLVLAAHPRLTAVIVGTD